MVRQKCSGIRRSYLAAEAVMSKSAATGVSPKEGRDVRRLHYATDRRYIKKSADKM